MKSETLRCAACKTEYHDPGETHDGAGFNGYLRITCGCGAETLVYREVVVRFDYAPIPPGDSYVCQATPRTLLAIRTIKRRQRS